MVFVEFLFLGVSLLRKWGESSSFMRVAMVLRCVWVVLDVIYMVFCGWWSGAIEVAGLEILSLE